MTLVKKLTEINNSRMAKIISLHLNLTIFLVTGVALLMHLVGLKKRIRLQYISQANLSKVAIAFNDSLYMYLSTTDNIELINFVATCE
jgi:hypothetical protein